MKIFNKCGENITWALSDDGILTLSGSGKMYDYAHSEYRFMPHGMNRKRSEIFKN